MTNFNKKFSDLEKNMIYNHFLSCLDREENLTHYRISWGLQWSVALFASLITIQQISDKIDHVFLYLSYIMIILSGIFSSSIMYFAIKGGHRQISYLIVSIQNIMNETDYSPDDNGIKNISIDELKKSTWSNNIYLRPFGEIRNSHIIGLRLSSMLPISIGMIWVFIAFFLGAKAI